MASAQVLRKQELLQAGKKKIKLCISGLFLYRELSASIEYCSETGGNSGMVVEEIGPRPEAQKISGRRFTSLKLRCEGKKMRLAHHCHEF
uniref:Uncharacterized protein n=1 Tax=Solanum lycopersicum TaxID=4081 RepID=A0A3Q7JYP3_SOLLC